MGALCPCGIRDGTPVPGARALAHDGAAGEIASATPLTPAGTANREPWPPVPQEVLPGPPSEGECARHALHAAWGLLQEVPLEGLGALQIRELPLADGASGSTGNQLWPSSVALGRALLREPSLVAGKAVLELGAGCGFASIVAARFAREVIVTDLDADTLENACHNLGWNGDFWRCRADPGEGPAGKASVHPLNWHDVVRRGWPDERRVDVVIASDILYGNWSSLIARVVGLLLLPGGLFVMLSAEDRGGLEFFEEHMIAAGFRVQRSHCHDDDQRFLLFLCQSCACSEG